jgi:hypothetical protein
MTSDATAEKKIPDGVGAIETIKLLMQAPHAATDWNSAYGLGVLPLVIAS